MLIKAGCVATLKSQTPQDDNRSAWLPGFVGNSRCRIIITTTATASDELTVRTLRKMPDFRLLTSSKSSLMLLFQSKMPVILCLAILLIVWSNVLSGSVASQNTYDVDTWPAAKSKSVCFVINFTKKEISFYGAKV